MKEYTFSTRAIELENRKALGATSNAPVVQHRETKQRNARNECIDAHLNMDTLALPCGLHAPILTAECQSGVALVAAGEYKEHIA